MNRSFRPHLVSVVLGIGLTIALLSTTSAMGPGPQLTSIPKSPAWPPRPEDIVNLRDRADVPWSSEVVIYTVPLDRWFVVTGSKLSSGGCSYELLEDIGGIRTVLREVRTNGSDFPAELDPDNNSPLGWAIRPGSNLVVRNAGSCSGPSYTTNVYWTLRGYLAR